VDIAFRTVVYFFFSHFDEMAMLHNVDSRETPRNDCRCRSRLIIAVCALLSLTPIPAYSADEPPYDLVIVNGKIVDGAGNPWYFGDVAIRGDRIVAVGRVPKAPAKRTIDAKGFVVAPGFIDMHSHSDYLLLEDGNAQSKVRQGVTTEVFGEGTSAAPQKGKRAPVKETDEEKTARWTTLGGYFEALEKSGISVNVASYVGLDNVWQGVMGTSFERPTAAEFEQMKSILDEAMQEGAFGLSSLLAMPPGSLATTDDIVELCKVVSRHGGIFSSHIRNEGTGVFDSVKEAIAVGERAGVPVDIIHLKIADQKYWGRMNEVVGLIEAARQRGVNVQANAYPYTRGNNNLSSIIPPWAHEGGNAKMLERLKDAAERERMKKDIRDGIDGWYNHYTAVGGDWSRMLINGKGTYTGLTMDRVIAALTKGKNPAPDPLDVLFDVLLQENGSVPTVYAHHTDKDMTLALVQPWCSIGSDGSAYAIEGPLRRGMPHPRSFGTFPRVLGVYVRELNLLRLEDAVRKMTSLNAAKLGIFDRGLLRAGTFADVVVFDPAKIIDHATYEDPFQYSEGIVHVIVNGQPVLDAGHHTDARPGRALRHKSVL
jgi:N-acyl-D-amino-acid deacylase